MTIDLLGLQTFVKYGNEVLLGFIPRRILSIAKVAGRNKNEIPVKLFASAKANAEMCVIINETYQKLSNDLLQAHKEFRSKDKKFEKDKLMHGSITEAKQLELDNAKRLFEKLHSTVVTLAECLDFDVPVLVVSCNTRIHPPMLNLICRDASRKRRMMKLAVQVFLFGMAVKREQVTMDHTVMQNRKHFMKIFPTFLPWCHCLRWVCHLRRWAAINTT
jgi:hypothetical protein